MEISTTIDRDMQFTVTGDYTPGADDPDVGWNGQGEVENVKVFFRRLNITSTLNEQELQWFMTEFLDYCDECVGNDH